MTGMQVLGLAILIGIGVAVFGLLFYVDSEAAWASLVALAFMGLFGLGMALLMGAGS